MYEDVWSFTLSVLSSDSKELSDLVIRYLHPSISSILVFAPVEDAVSTYERLAELLELPENQSQATAEMWNNMGTIFSVYGPLVHYFCSWNLLAIPGGSVVHGVLLKQRRPKPCWGDLAKAQRAYEQGIQFVEKRIPQSANAQEKKDALDAIVSH